jgi:hypothetical protein
MGVRFGSGTAFIIPDGEEYSNVVNAQQLMDFVSALVYGPTDADGKTYSFQVNPNPNATAATTGWRLLNGTDGNALALPGADEAQRFDELPLAGSVRVRASAAVTIDVVFPVTGIRDQG